MNKKKKKRKNITFFLFPKIFFWGGGGGSPFFWPVSSLRVTTLSLWLSILFSSPPPLQSVRELRANRCCGSDPSSLSPLPQKEDENYRHRCTILFRLKPSFLLFIIYLNIILNHRRSFNYRHQKKSKSPEAVRIHPEKWIKFRKTECGYPDYIDLLEASACDNNGSTYMYMFCPSSFLRSCLPYASESTVCNSKRCCHCCSVDCRLFFASSDWMLSPQST